MSTEVPALHLRIPAYRGQDARSGVVLSELPFTPAIEAYFDDARRRGQRRCRKPSEWWKVPHLVAYLRVHPAVGDVLVGLLLPVLQGDEAWEARARRVGITVQQLHALHLKTTAIIREEEWDRWRASARSANCAPSSNCDSLMSPNALTCT